MIGSTEVSQEEMPEKTTLGQEENLKIPKENMEEKDRRCVRSKLFIILAAETHLKVTVQMEKVRSETEVQHDKLQDGTSL